MITYGYIVQNKCSSDDEIAKQYSILFPLASNREDAWRSFTKTAGYDREYWNKLGYIARKIKVTIEFYDK